MDVQPHLAAKLGEAWQHRFGHRIEAAVLSHADLVARLGLFGEVPSQDQYKTANKKYPAYIVAGVLALGSSIARFNGRHATSSQILDLFADEDSSFYLAFERGHCAYRDGKYVTALQHFGQARSLAISKATEAFAQSNILFCLENLGLDFTKSAQELFSMTQLLRPDELAPLAAQVRAFEMRLAWREGNYSHLRTLLGTLEPSASSGQDRFYAQWLTQLPYHSIFEKKSNDQPLLEDGSTRMYQYALRVRTLINVADSSDFIQGRIIDLVDRIYLWVWKWMADPQLPVDMIVDIICGIATTNSFDRMTAEDRELLANAIGWLSLFDSSSHRFYCELRLKIHGERGYIFPILEFENLIIQYLTARRDRLQEVNVLAEAIRAHKLFDQHDLFLGALYQPDKPIPPLASRTFKTIASRIAKHLDLIKVNPRKRFDVNLLTYEITDRKSGKSVVSEPLCKAMDLLRRSPQITCDDFVLACFSLRSYDQQIHARRLFNLLSRIKTHLDGEFRYSVRSGLLSTTGPWEKIRFIEDQSLSGTLRHNQRWRQLRTSGNMLRSPRIPKQSNNALHKIFNRQELQAYLGKSKSSAHRWIVKAMERGILDSEGKGRSTRYILLKPIEDVHNV